ncbi:MAG: hypothetical protein AAF226_19675, partial [Verrucomicrobiota bacterium]
MLVFGMIRKDENGQLFLPQKDRSYWQPESADTPLLYLAWGRRNFEEEYRPACRHQGWTAFLIQEGRPKITLNGKSINVSRGDLALIGPDCMFGWPSLVDNRCKFVLWMWRGLDAGEVTSSGFSILSPQRSYRESLISNHDLCRKEVQAMDGYSGDYLTACQMSFQVLVRRALESCADSDSYDLVERAAEWMDRHLDSKNPIARLCDYL